MSIVNQSRICPDMDVFGSDGNTVGRVKEVRDSDFLVDRPLARDVYIPFSAVTVVVDQPPNPVIDESAAPIPVVPLAENGVVPVAAVPYIPSTATVALPATDEPYDPITDTTVGAVSIDIPADQVDDQGWPNPPMT